MKKIIIIIVLALVPTMSFAYDYVPFLEEGKTWKYSYDNQAGKQYKQSLIVRGDTTINHFTYKKIYDVSSDEYQYALREEEKKVYCVFPTKDAPQLIYDFGKEAGEIVSEVTDNNEKTIVRVLAVDAVKYGDRFLRRMEVVEDYYENDILVSSSDCIWIEGLGSYCGLVSPFQYPGNYSTFHSCWIGDETLGENELFWTKGFLGKKYFSDGLKYYLEPDSYEAIIDNDNTWTGELELPSEVSYKGEIYSVKSVGLRAFDGCKELTMIRIPKTIESVIHQVLAIDDATGAASPDIMNFFVGCTALESIEVDEGNPIMSSLGGILFNQDRTKLYGYPAGRKSELYIVPEGITAIGSYAFAYAGYLNTIDLSESVSRIGSYAFRGCKLDALVIRGILDSKYLHKEIFYALNESAKLYVQASEMDRYKDIFPGTILPLEDYQSGMLVPTFSLNEPMPLYNLAGQKVNALYKGIVIQNGRKVIVK